MALVQHGPPGGNAQPTAHFVAAAGVGALVHKAQRLVHGVRLRVWAGHHAVGVPVALGLRGPVPREHSKWWSPRPKRRHPKLARGGRRRTQAGCRLRPAPAGRGPFLRWPAPF